jgi:ATP-dependent HslUV protease ATP-binding subunit HslU
MKQEHLTPSQIVEELDKYIIGQANAKENVAIALRNRWRRMNAPPEIRKEIVPNNILMIGSTGVGKTEVARRLAKLAHAPFVKVEASKFTEVGYVGRDVESMVRDLVEQSVHLVKTEKQKEVEEKAHDNVEDIILNALIPPINASLDNGQTLNELKSDEELNHQTRERFREKIKNGDLEDRKIEIDVNSSPKTVGVMAPGMDEASMGNLQDMIQGMIPKKTKKRKVTIKEARKMLFEEEAAKLIDMDEVNEVAIRKAENAGIIFIDEIDKIATGGKDKGGNGNVSREGVQRDLLPIVEGSTVTTKYGVVSTSHVLFISAGAFHLSKPSDLIPELQGRFPIRVELDSLTKEDFFKILKTPKSSLTKQYTALLGSEGVELSFEDDALEELASIAFEVNTEVENIGARRLHTVMSQLLNDFLFDVPDKIGANAKIRITKDMVEDRLSGLVKNKDLSEFIL